ncbi:DUF305 domain-containing protein [Streptomyces thermodiastaticus]|uniref:DUF305 domain-containing protein n=1 Tax=Streptomyces thermodiastaticus TaxID=44061 RepID=UPI001679952C|nr:DUF305 domain-containing protein [Streptomyces thermodiastaticus]MCE7551061.1 DUF305 domain-containing protein [Streptomyces thermodiastaticus]GHF58338.1 lipoprotein [Streptomyces thermodiastaticus]
MKTRSLPLRRTRLGRTTAVAVLAAAALFLTACGGGDDTASSAHAGHSASATAPTARSDHDAHDVTFAQQMIPHHRQAVAMAELAPARARSQQVKDLAEKIKKAQDPEITTMSGWLRTWGEQVPEDDGADGMAGMDDMAGMDHSGHPASPMPGVMDHFDMEKLKKLSGADFDRAFLQMMVEHHEGALTMARAEQSDGTYAPARTLAASVVATQTAEIAEMKKLLGDQ